MQVAGLESVVPNDFNTLSQADDALNILQNWTVHHLDALLPHMQQAGKGTNMPPELIFETLRLENQFLQFLSATASLASAANAKSDTIMQQRIVLLQTQAQIFLAILVDASGGLDGVFRELQIREPNNIT